MGRYVSESRTIRDAPPGLQLELPLQPVHRKPCNNSCPSNSRLRSLPVPGSNAHKAGKSACCVHFTRHASASALVITSPPTSPHGIRDAEIALTAEPPAAGVGVLSSRLSASPKRCSENSFSTNSVTPRARTCCSLSGVAAPVKMITG